MNYTDFEKELSSVKDLLISLANKYSSHSSACGWYDFDDHLQNGMIFLWEILRKCEDRERAYSYFYKYISYKMRIPRNESYRYRKLGIKNVYMEDIQDGGRYTLLCHGEQEIHTDARILLEAIKKMPELDQNFLFTGIGLNQHYESVAELANATNRPRVFICRKNGRNIHKLRREFGIKSKLKPWMKGVTKGKSI